jgi:hypothetical protein
MVPVAEFDEDAELQANIWNSLCRKEEDLGPDGNIFRITGESFRESRRSSMKKTAFFDASRAAAESIQ